MDGDSLFSQIPFSFALCFSDLIRILLGVTPLPRPCNISTLLVLILLITYQGRSTATHQTSDSYDVFLSFSGPDTRHSFTGSLHRALTSQGFKVFMDVQAMKPGDQISRTLVNAIQQSRISIVVLSQNYASSTWCLDELVEILECMKLKNHLVWPIFYRVAPSDVRCQRKSYAEAMAEHEESFGHESHKVQKWRSALTEVAGVQGWRHPNGLYDYELIEEIVKEATSKLKRVQLDVGEHVTQMLPHSLKDCQPLSFFFLVPCGLCGRFLPFWMT